CCSRGCGRWCCSAPGGCCSPPRHGGWWCRVAERGTVLAESLRTYRLVGGMWIRSTMTYRASFLMTVFGNFAVTGLEFVGILLMFSQVDRLGGYGLPEIAFLYGAAGTSFGLADLAFGSVGRLGQRVRGGTLDTF